MCFTKWVDLYRGYDEHRYQELCSMLVRWDVPHRKQTARPDSKVAAMYGSAGSLPGTPNTRSGDINPSSFWAEAELERTEKAPKLYILRIKEKDVVRVRGYEAELNAAEESGR